MEFFIKRGATLPLLKMQVVNDGRVSYQNFMKFIETSSLYFSMVDLETGTPKIINRQAQFVSKTGLSPNAPTEYYVIYQFTSKDTSKVGRYEGQFLMKNDEGNLVVPIRENLYINIQDSFMNPDQCC